MFWKKKINFNNGILPDLRSEEEKALDYTQNELVASIAQPVWVKKTTFKSYPKRMQSKSGSCVMQGVEKERGIMAQNKFGEFVVYSANIGYQDRDNPNGEGSTYIDSVRSTNNGSVPEILLPSQGMTDKQMMEAKVKEYHREMAKVFGAKRVKIIKNIDVVASTLDATGKGVGLTLMFGPGEWFYNYEVKEKLPSGQWPWGHYVVAVDYTLNNKGEKCLVIEDSSCEDGYPVRLVNESFFNNRTYWEPSYIVNFKTYEEKPEKPKFDGSVKSLQDILKYEGLFPANVDSTGYFGSVTKSALIKFQLKYNIEPPEGVFGPITKQKLSELY